MITASKSADADPRIPKGREHDAGLIIDATATSVAARATFDPGLLDVPGRRT